MGNFLLKSNSGLMSIMDTFQQGNQVSLAGRTNTDDAELSSKIGIYSGKSPQNGFPRS